MQIQAITNNFNCKTYQSQNKNNTLNFKGELGKQVGWVFNPTITFKVTF